MGKENPSFDRFVFTSSIADEAWHPEKSPGAYEWWYFDALSDAGDEAVSIVFLDTNLDARSPADGPVNGKPGPLSLIRPAVSFTYYSNGKTICQAKAEFSPEDFSASETVPQCSIGGSGFRFDSALYGSGYLVSIDLPLSNDRRVRANLEWLLIESDLDAISRPIAEDGHWWNMVAPRCDVSGKITIDGPRAHDRAVYSFRGTGYHDHHLDEGWLTGSLRSWLWGRAHFADTTAVYCKFSEIGSAAGRSLLLLTGDSTLRCLEASENGVTGAANGGASFDLAYLDGAEEIRLKAAPIKLIESTFYRQRFLTLITLSGHGHEHSTNGLSEVVAPPALRYRMLSWLNRLRGHGSEKVL